MFQDEGLDIDNSYVGHISNESRYLPRILSLAQPFFGTIFEIFAFLNYRITHELMKWIQGPKGKLQQAQDDPPGGFRNIVQGVHTLWLWRYAHSPCYFRDFGQFWL